jgi:hypothetical protein
MCYVCTFLFLNSCAVYFYLQETTETSSSMTVTTSTMDKTKVGSPGEAEQVTEIITTTTTSG